MSISVALSAALTGLAANTRQAQIVSNNIANATTEGYGARTVITGSLLTGGEGNGVRVVGIERRSDPIVTGNRRIADADLGAVNTGADFYSRLETLVGTPDDQGSLSGRLDVFETSIVIATNASESDAALGGVLFAADAVTDKLNQISDGIQTMRAEADTEIGTAIGIINNALQELDALNDQLLREQGFGGSGNTILDQQQVLIDRVAEYVPVREYRDPTGIVRLYATDGTKLLDFEPTVFEFDSNRLITPDMTLGTPLSDITVDGAPLPTSAGQPAMSGGKLRALFDVRDDFAVDAQTKLDAVARDLAERFEDPALDATRAATDPGLFTDLGALTSPLNEVGLSGRLQVNALVDPARGGAVFRIRDGLGAAAPGDVGDASLLQGMANALSDTRVTASGGFTVAPRSMTVLGGELLSIFGTERQFADTAQAFATTRQQVLLEAELELGVNTDSELQRLVLVEQMYQANARVIQVVSEMMDELLRSIG